MRPVTIKTMSLRQLINSMYSCFCPTPILILQILWPSSPMPFVYLYVHPFEHLSLNRSLSQSLFLPFSLSFFLSLSIALSLFLFFSFSLSFSLSLSLSFFLSLSLSIYLSISLPYFADQVQRRQPTTYTTNGSCKNEYEENTGGQITWTCPLEIHFCFLCFFLILLTRYLLPVCTVFEIFAGTERFWD